MICWAFQAKASRSFPAFNVLQQSLNIPVVILLTVLLLRVLFRRPWLAYVARFGLLLVVLVATRAELNEAVFGVLFLSLVMLVLTRLGLACSRCSSALSSRAGRTSHSPPIPDRGTSRHRW